jgi:hypothetical protein
MTPTTHAINAIIVIIAIIPTVKDDMHTEKQLDDVVNSQNKA